jgi:DNA-binding CsgD family transcriptional regulator
MGVAHLLDVFLSPPADELYWRLLAVDKLHVNDSGELSADDAVVRELVAKRFANWTADGDGLVAVAPRLAVESALLALERGIIKAHEAAAETLAAAPALQELYETSTGREAGDQRIRIIGAAESAQLLIDLLDAARHEVLAFQTVPIFENPLWTVAAAESAPSADKGSDASVLDRLCGRGIRVRCILSEEFLDSPHSRDAIDRHTRQGFEARAIHTLPTSMIIIDSRIAFVSLDDEATTGTVMFRNGAARDLLQATFELYWSQSIPLGAHCGCGDGAPSETQLMILRLLAAGLKDKSIARHLQVSLRTVWRNLATLCDLVQAPTRFTLASIATDRGWIGSPAITRGQEDKYGAAKAIDWNASASCELCAPAPVLR